MTTITLDTKFQTIRVSGSWYSFVGWDGVHAVIDTEDGSRSTFNFSVTELGFPKRGLNGLQVMQAIYERDGQFTNRDGDEVPISVVNLDDIDTLDALLDAGYPNPFVDYPNAYYQRGILGLDAGLTTTRSTDDNGLITHVERRSEIPALSSPEGDTMTVSMAAWTTRLYLSKWQIVYDYVEEDGVTLDNRHDQIEWTALLAMLEGLRVSGPEVPQDLDTTASSYNHGNPLDGAVFQFTPEGGTAQEFSVTRFSWTLAGDAEWITELICECTPSASSTYDQASYAGFIQSRDVTIGSVDDSLPPVRGSYAVPHRAKSFDFPNGMGLVVRDSMMYTRLRDGTEVPIIGDAGLGIDTSQLDAHSSTDVDWYMPRPPVTSIHHTANDGDRTIRFRSPLTVLRPGESVTQDIHNRVTAQHGAEVTLEDMDGAELLKLRPTQRAEFRLTRSYEGVGEIIGIDIPRRRHFLAGDDIGNLGGNRINYSSTYYAAPLPTGGSGLTDTDAFDIGTVVFADGTSWNDLNTDALIGSFSPKRGGLLSVELRLELEVDGLGTLPSPWTTSLRGYRSPGNPYEVAGTARTHPELAGVGTRYELFIGWRGICHAGDLYTPLITWPKNSGLAMSDIDVAEFYLNVELEPYIEVEVTE